MGAATTEEVEVVDRTIGKLKLKMRRPTDAQIALLGRLAVAAQREPEKYFSRLVDTFFRIVENLLVDAGDIAAVEGAIIEDKLTIEDIVTGLGTKDATAPAGRVRRAR